jgi:NADPH2:quinone reductase
VKAEIDLRQMMSKRITLTASTLRPQSVQNKGRLARALRERVWPLFASKGLKPVIHARFPLTDAAGAHKLMESDTHIGKIVLVT